MVMSRTLRCNVLGNPVCRRKNEIVTWTELSEIRYDPAMIYTDLQFPILALIVRLYIPELPLLSMGAIILAQCTQNLKSNSTAKAETTPKKVGG